MASGVAISALVSLGLGLFNIFDSQLKLLDQQPAAFRRLPELLAPCLGQHQIQPFDFQPADGHFTLRQRQQFTLRRIAPMLRVLFEDVDGGRIERLQLPLAAVA